MALIVIFWILSFGGTALTYIFTGLYHDWWWFWTIPLLAMAYFLVCFALWLIFLYIGGLFVDSDQERIYKPNPFAQWTIRQTCRVILLLLGVRTHITGLGKIPEKQPIILIHNHLSVFDEFAIAGFFPKHLIFISKPGNFRIPIAGAWMRYAGYISIKQDDIANGVEVISLATDYINKKKRSICVAPEGTRNKDFPNPLLLPFHAGTFRLAQDSGAPIVIMAIQNTNCIFQRFPKARTHVYLDVVGIMEKDEYGSMTTRQVADKARGMIEKRLEHKEARFYHFRPKKKKEEGAE